MENATIIVASLVRYSIRRLALAFQNAYTSHAPMAKLSTLNLVGANASKPLIVQGIRCSTSNLATVSVLLGPMTTAPVTLNLTTKLANASAPGMLHQSATNCRNSTRMIASVGVLLCL